MLELRFSLSSRNSSARSHRSDWGKDSIELLDSSWRLKLIGPKRSRRLPRRHYAAHVDHDDNHTVVFPPAGAVARDALTGSMRGVRRLGLFLVVLPRGVRATPVRTLRRFRVSRGAEAEVEPVEGLGERRSVGTERSEDAHQPRLALGARSQVVHAPVAAGRLAQDEAGLDSTLDELGDSLLAQVEQLAERGHGGWLLRLVGCLQHQQEVVTLRGEALLGGYGFGRVEEAAKFTAERRSLRHSIDPWRWRCLSGASPRHLGSQRLPA